MLFNHETHETHETHEKKTKDKEKEISFLPSSYYIKDWYLHTNLLYSGDAGKIRTGSISFDRKRLMILDARKIGIC